MRPVEDQHQQQKCQNSYFSVWPGYYPVNMTGPVALHALIPAVLRDALLKFYLRFAE